MIPLAETTSADTSYLLAAIGALVTTIGVLFWQLLSAKNEVATAYKEILPAATLLMKTVEALQKLVGQIEKKRRGEGL